MTPFPKFGLQQFYNSVHIFTRNPVEQTNDVLKCRCHVLDSALKFSPRKNCSITVACYVLHHISTKHHLEVKNLQEHLHDDVIC